MRFESLLLKGDSNNEIDYFVSVNRLNDVFKLHMASSTAPFGIASNAKLVNKATLPASSRLHVNELASISLNVLSIRRRRGEEGRRRKREERIKENKRLRKKKTLQR